MVKTFIRWFGNKSKYVNSIFPLFPDKYNTYIEPFLGSGALFLHAKPSKWIINDINKDVFIIWKTVKRSPEHIITFFKYFSKYFVPLNNTDKVLLCRHIVTKMIPQMRYDKDRAVVFLLMKFCVFLGILIQNNKYRFSGIERAIYYNKPLYFFSEKYYNLLQNTSKYLNASKGKIYNKDYKEVIAKAKTGDFVFLDPPYLDDHEYCVQYNHFESIDNKFMDELVLELERLDNLNVKWMLTQADNPFIRNLFKKYNISSYQVYRLRSNKYKNELIIKNY